MDVGLLSRNIQTGSVETKWRKNIVQIAFIFAIISHLSVASIKVIGLLTNCEGFSNRFTHLPLYTAIVIGVTVIVMLVSVTFHITFVLESILFKI